jgi:hypothetical protein
VSPLVFLWSLTGVPPTVRSDLVYAVCLPYESICTEWTTTNANLAYPTPLAASEKDQLLDGSSRPRRSARSQTPAAQTEELHDHGAALDKSDHGSDDDDAPKNIRFGSRGDRYYLARLRPTADQLARMGLRYSACA